MNEFFSHLTSLTLEMAPWLVFGLLIAGLIKSWVPEERVIRWLGGQGMGPVIRGAIIGAPLPLCSCSVIPMAIGLRRKGASPSSTVSFLVSTPETGVDSIALTWSMLGPFMTIARPVGAILSAMVAGFLTLLVERHLPAGTIPAPTVVKPSCDGGCGCSGKSAPAPEKKTLFARTRSGIDYALNDLWDDLALWLLAGILITAAVTTWIPSGFLTEYTQAGWLAMILIVLTSMPIYVCATASTPMAAAMLYSGISPGMTLAFLLAGPATNLAPLGIIRRELGGWVLTAYLSGIFLSAVGLGLLTDQVAGIMGWIPVIEPGKMEEWMPEWLAQGSAGLLIGLTLRTAWHRWRTPKR